MRRQPDCHSIVCSCVVCTSLYMHVAFLACLPQKCKLSLSSPTPHLYNNKCVCPCGHMYAHTHTHTDTHTHAHTHIHTHTQRPSNRPYEYASASAGGTGNYLVHLFQACSTIKPNTLGFFASALLHAGKTRKAKQNLKFVQAVKVIDLLLYSS